MKMLRVAAAVIAASTLAAQAQDATKGGQTFNSTCGPCHSIGKDAQNKLGPELNGLDGRKAGAAANFNYSDAVKNSGVVWSAATFKQFVKGPQAMIPGTKMFFAGVKNDQDANDLWAYVAQFNADGSIKK